MSQIRNSGSWRVLFHFNPTEVKLQEIAMMNLLLAQYQ